MKNRHIRHLFKLFFGWILLALSMNTQAAGPSTVAKLNSDLWPNSITSKQEFDTASRAEILIFLSVYKELFSTDIKPSVLKIKSINAVSFERWKARFKTTWLNTFLDATKTCKNEKELGCSFKENNFEKLLVYSENFKNSLPEKYNPWLEMSDGFYRTYLKEQARLAALFPNPTSEILPLSDIEIIGDRFKDGEFLITLDDGPTKTDDTAKYSKLLKDNGISAFFFAVGDSLETKMKMTSAETVKNIYQGQCLASHGYHHKSHQTWKEWKSSIDKNQALIKQITGKNSPIAFRPPYGQVQQDLVNYLASQHSTIYLWNIDSQDWHSGITAKEVSLRVKKLMLLWRKGIILFHDVHQKAFVAIPEVVQFAKGPNLHWIDCSSVKMNQQKMDS